MLKIHFRLQQTRLIFVRLFVMLFSVVGLGALVYFKVYIPYRSIAVTKHLVLGTIDKRGFLVLGSRPCNISIIKQKNNKGWLKSLLLKHIVSVHGVVRVFYGFPIEKRSFADKVYYDSKRDCVVVHLGKPQVLASEIQFPISYKTESGVIYKALSEDKEKDINEMMHLLKYNAENSTKQWLKTQDTNELAGDFRIQIMELSRGKVKNVCFE